MNGVGHDEKGDICIWSPDEIVYSAGDISKEAYLVMEGAVRIFSVDNLLLNRLGPDELFGGTSLILDECRSVNAVAGSSGLTARKVPKTYIGNMLNAEPVLGAFLRKTQNRLIESNRQSMELANKLDKVVGQLERHFTALDTVASDQDDIFERMLEVKRKVDQFKQGASSGVATEE